MAIIQGTTGNDLLTGGIDDDRIIGSAGDDILSGGGGNNTVDYSDLGKPITVFRGVVDILTGTDSTARCIGEVNILTGGGGRDRFVIGDRSGAYYVGQGNNDYATITDFNLRQDSLDLGNAKNISFKIESSGTIDLFSGKDPTNRDLIAKI